MKIAAEGIRNITSRISKSTERRKRQLLRSIEYRRIRKYRKKERPGYTHCKNCGTELKGMYCHRCGQYALDPEQPFWKYVLQYFENVYQFDGKVWTTLWMLFRRPGFLTTEFRAGKIASYVHPMRLLMFITVVFFLFFFMFFNGKLDSALGSEGIAINESLSIKEARNSGIVLDSLDSGNRTVAILSDSSRIASHSDLFRILEVYADTSSLDGGDRKDTLLVKVPEKLLQTHIYKETGKWRGHILLEFNETHSSSAMDKFTLFKERIMSALSGYASLTALLLIPLLGLLLQWMYRKSRIPYMGHFVFSLHFASFFFIMLSVYLVAAELWKYGGAPLYIFLFCILVYMTAASHWVYKGNGWIKSIIKSFLVLFLYFLSVTLIIVVIMGYLAFAEKDILMEVFNSGDILVN